MEQQLIRHKGESSEFIVSFVTFQSQAVLMVLQITFNGKCLEKNQVLLALLLFATSIILLIKC